jgi:flagellar biosynthesis repressor protein FlbT
MALKVELKPGEKIVIGKVAIRNGDTRARLFIEGQAPILREKDILNAQTADTPAKHIYFAVQLMYVEGGIEKHHDLYFQFVRDFVAAAPSATPLIAEINNRILSGDLYKALKAAKELVAYEQRLMSAAGLEKVPGTADEPIGASLRQDGAADPPRS